VVQEPTKTVDKVLPKASFKITGGKNGAAKFNVGGRYGFDTVPKICAIYIADSHTDTSGLEISGLTGPVDAKNYYPYDDEGDNYIGSEAQKFHHNVCRIINANSSVSKFTAVESRSHSNWSGPDPTNTTIYSDYKQGPQFNGKRVLIEFEDTPYSPSYQASEFSVAYDSPFTAGRKIRYWGGSFSEGSNNAVTSILIDRQKSLNEPVYWETSHDQLAADIVTAFNLGPLSTEYVATRDGGDGEQVFISPIDTEDPESYNNKTLSVITDGVVIASAFKSFGGGRNMILGKEKIVEFTFSNINSNTPQSFGSEIWIMITDPSNPDVPYKFGST
jgi:hypothetical protein